MKTILSLILAGLLFSCNSNTDLHNTNSEVLDPKKEKEVLRYLKEVEWPQAYREQDTILLDRILGDDFQMVTNDGEWSNKKLQMERIKSAAMEHDSFRYEIKRLEVFENGTAIVAGTGHIQNDTIRHIYQSSNVLIKRDGTWKAVLSHVSGYKQVE